MYTLYPWWIAATRLLLSEIRGSPRLVPASPWPPNQGCGRPGQPPAVRSPGAVASLLCMKQVLRKKVNGHKWHEQIRCAVKNFGHSYNSGISVYMAECGSTTMASVANKM